MIIRTASRHLNRRSKFNKSASSVSKIESGTISVYRQHSSSTSSTSSFVTTPIFYVNSTPHIGHLYTALLSDAYSRFERMRGEEVMFATGTDEHGLKIEKAAAAVAVTPQTHCDKVSQQFDRLCREFDVSNTHFIRTTDEKHKRTVSEFWEDLNRKGYIYKNKYAGWYSINDEAFVPEVQLTEAVDGSGKKVKINSESGHQVEWCEEENYMFRLSKVIPKVQEWILDKPVVPAKFNDLVKTWLDAGLPDLSISRPSSRSAWGIPVPNDPSQTIYVWLDALLNYLTVAKSQKDNFFWPPTLQVVGKDILKFHAIYWPAFLIANEMQPPERILCHSHWTIDNVKMSKSLGNVVDPFTLKAKYGSEAVRFFLLSNGVPHSDGNFNEEKLVKMVNTALADTFGNLLARCSSKALNPRQVQPACSACEYDGLPDLGKELKQTLECLAETVEVSYEDLNFYRGIEHILACSRIANLYVQETKPWEIVKKSPDDPNLALMMNLVMETLRICGTMLQPVIPSLSSSLLDRLNVPVSQRSWQDTKIFGWTENSNTKDLGNAGDVFFKRIKL